MPPQLAPGFKTSEFSLSTIVAVLGFALGAVALFGGALLESGLGLPPWVRGVVAVAGVGGSVLTAFGYQKSRTMLKLEHLKATVTPMLPQLLQVANEVKGVVQDIKAGGLLAPAGDAPMITTTTVVPGPDPTVTQMPLQVGQVVKTMLPSSPLATALTDKVEQLATDAGAKAAAAVTTDAQAAKVLGGG